VLISGINKIIEAVIPENENNLHGKLICAISTYREAIELVTLHCLLENEEIEEFQAFADELFETWTFIFGHKGVTNYINSFGSGHIHDFLIKHRCLSLFSQQGWEALNNKVQA